MLSKYNSNRMLFNSVNRYTALLNNATVSKVHASTSAELPRKTVLYDFHNQHNGKMVDFAGWLMPVMYKDLGIKESHIHTRTKCSLFDVSHMMQTRVFGRDRFKYIESLVVSDIEGLKLDTGCLTVFTNEQGGINDDLIVNNTGLHHLYIVSNAGCSEKDFAAMKKAEEGMRQAGMTVYLERVEDMGLLALQGPMMQAVLQAGVSIDLSKLTFMSTVETDVYGISDCRITRCGYTGEDGVEISVPAKETAKLAERLLAFGDGKVCKLAGLGARDTLRLEAGLCLYGNDIDEKTTPIEAGLAWTISKKRRAERNFPGAEIILDQLKNKPLIRRVGLKLLSNSGPSARQHMKIFDAEGKDEVGEITSGCLSPSMGEQISMGYVQTPFSKAGTTVQVEIRNKKHLAEVVKMPFVPTNYYIPKAKEGVKNPVEIEETPKEKKVGQHIPKFF